MSIYLHSVFRWYFDGPHKPAQAMPEAICQDGKARGPRGSVTSVAALDDAHGCLPAARRHGAASGGGRSVAAGPELAAPSTKAQAERNFVSSRAEHDDAFERLPPTRQLPVGLLFGPLPTPAPASQPMRPMLSPHQLDLDAPELLAAYDAHFGRQRDQMFLADVCVLTPQFFLDVRLLECPAQARRLANALWPRDAGPETFRALAYVSLPTLRRRVEQAAHHAQLELDDEHVSRAAQLLRLHGLEVCRIELYTQLLFECQRLSRQCSRTFHASDTEYARRVLAELDLSEVADQFLEGADGPPAFEPVAAREQFENVLDTFVDYFREASTLPSHRLPGAFYPPCPSYVPAPAGPPPYPG